MIDGIRVQHEVDNILTHRANHRRRIVADVFHPSVLHDCGDRPAARINWGRWIVDCGSSTQHPESGAVTLCAAACATDPEHRVALCFLCGAVYERVAFPRRPVLDEIEVLLLARPWSHLRNWTPGESVKDLRRENHVLLGGAA